jgi:hypothetical protein
MPEIGDAISDIPAKIAWQPLMRAGIQAIDYMYIIPSFRQTVDHMRTDKPGATSNKDFHATILAGTAASILGMFW